MWRPIVFRELPIFEGENKKANKLRNSFPMRNSKESYFEKTRNKTNMRYVIQIIRIATLFLYNQINKNHGKLNKLIKVRLDLNDNISTI